MKKILAIALCLVSYLKLQSQDTLTVMTYNLLGYGTTGHSSLSPSSKNPHLKTIIKQILPDIFGANEIANNSLYCDNILVNVLNQDGRNYYKRANYSNVTNSTLVNMLFYNSNKLEISNQYFINGGIRDMMLYKLYYKDPQPIMDTLFLYVCLVHLKAGSNASDYASRNNETQAVMNFLNNLNLPSNTNLLIMGDMNLYTSSEVAYQNLVNHSNTTIRFYDPINRPGGWSNDINFTDIHTQSTRLYSEPDGGIGGGLDDRFDHILMNANLINGNNRMNYVSGSYYAFGNDGNRFNQSINSSNTAVSQTVANALYSMSDHLPVISKIYVSSPTSLSPNHHLPLQWHITPTDFTFSSEKPLSGEVIIYNSLGQIICSKTLCNELSFHFDLKELNKGVYMVQFNLNGKIESRKIVHW